MSLMMILQLMIVLGALWVGSRYGSLALGAISGIGLCLLVFGFGLKPGTPPTDVIYIIIAAVTCAGIMQASGGMDWLIQIAERLLRKHPDRITPPLPRRWASLVDRLLLPWWPLSVYQTPTGSTSPFPVP